ncbi:hypothetical protein SRABI36_04959 [Pedobacter sp. Bi36]|nr:hypothetical protein SRABI36_04959 [Pedobacter sp. Bi36]CAH0315987.1 hypothetical protein SRABI126_04994 [Pedobacter sp. Bi126]
MKNKFTPVVALRVAIASLYSFGTQAQVSNLRPYDKSGIG